jgi:PAS domain S-box-containing protein
MKVGSSNPIFMRPSSNRLPARAVSVACAAITVVAASAVLAGWAFGPEPLRYGVIGDEPVRPSAAIAALFAGLALLQRRLRTARLLSIVPLALGAVTMLEWVFRVNTRFDGLLFPGTGIDMRMSMQAALTAFLAGLAGVFVRRKMLSQAFAAGAGFLAVLSIIAYAYGGTLLAAPNGVRIAPMTAILFTSWTIGALLDGTRGAMIDLIAVTSLVTQALIGALCLYAVRAGYLDVPFAVALLATASGFTLVFVTRLYTVRIQKSETLYRAIVETTHEGICVADANGRLTFVNERLAEMLGSSAGEVAGRRLDELVPHATGTGPLPPSERELVRADGSRIRALVTGSPVPGGDASIAFFSDITEIVEARETFERAHAILAARVAELEGAEALTRARTAVDLETMAARLAAANQELETFSYSVSHDLRAPLRAIDGFSRELAISYGDGLDDRARGYLQRIRAATQRMSRLIDDLLDLSRLTRKPLRRERVDVTALVRELADGAPAEICVADGLTVTADPHLLRVVLENLLGNAIKFSAHSERPRVEVFAHDGELVVRDNGTGFDSRYADKIFVPFQRLHGAEYEGTGIGLALVQRIVHRHGGTIRAESGPGHGATFYLTLGEQAA